MSWLEDFLNLFDMSQLLFEIVDIINCWQVTVVVKSSHLEFKRNEWWIQVHVMKLFIDLLLQLICIFFFNLTTVKQIFNQVNFVVQKINQSSSTLDGLTYLRVDLFNVGLNEILGFLNAYHDLSCNPFKEDPIFNNIFKCVNTFFMTLNIVDQNVISILNSLKCIFLLPSPNKREVLQFLLNPSSTQLSKCT